MEDIRTKKIVVSNKIRKRKRLERELEEVNIEIETLEKGIEIESLEKEREEENENK